MFSVRRVLLTFALGTALGAGPAIVAPAMAKPSDDDRDRDRTTSLAAVLSGRGVVGEDRDSNGWGVVNLRIRPNTGQVCFTYSVRKVDDPEKIYVYYGGPRDKNGPRWVEVELREQGSFGTGCRTITPKVAWAIVRQPGRYNVQVDGDDGAIRGQLRGSNDHDHDSDW